MTLVTIAIDSAADNTATIATMKTVALVVFLGFWVAVVVRLLLVRPERYREAARLPLDENLVPDPGKGAAPHG